MDIKSIFNVNLKAYREKIGLTQAQVAEKLGYAKETISGWENGRKEPSFDTLGKIAELYGISVADLFSDSSRPTFPSQVTSPAEFVWCLCALASSAFVEDVGVHDGQYGEYIHLSFASKAYEHDLPQYSRGGLALVSSLNSGALPLDIFAMSLKGITDNIERVESIRSAEKLIPQRTSVSIDPDDDDLPF